MDPTPIPRPGLRRRAGQHVRAVTDESVRVGIAPLSGALEDLSRRVDTLGASLGQLAPDLAPVIEQIVALDEMARRNELAIGALSQRVDECLEFLRLQHEAVRDALERLDDRPR